MATATWKRPKPVEPKVKEKQVSLILQYEQWHEVKCWMGWALQHRDAAKLRKRLSQEDRNNLRTAYELIDAKTKTNPGPEIEITDSIWVMFQIPTTLFRAVWGGGKLAHFTARSYGEICNQLNGVQAQ